ncbi:MAG: alpha/beta hydrolase [Ruminococcaceae bacterium]|nr:alpha/beta hydrolase [Oscillospiraceae bacterium]
MCNLWNGFPVETLNFEGREAHVVFPAPGTANGLLALKTEYWNAFPKAAEIPLLEQGFHLCFITNDNRWGVDEDLDRKARFVKFVTEKYGLATKTVPIGMSCGGLIAIKFAAKYPELVSCLYLDAPVLNYLSCPCGLGVGEPLGEGAGVQELLNALHMESMSQLIGYREMPLDKLPVLVQNRIPVVLVAGGSDVTVPFEENGALLQSAYEKAGLECQVYIKPDCGHHPHGLETPDEVICFILQHGKEKTHGTL